MSDDTQIIAKLNDLARKAMGVASRLVITEGIAAYDQLELSTIRQTVETFNDFSEDNNPLGERDFGSFLFQDETIFWKIDYYDKSLQHGSEDPADPSVTTRVLTIMLASEY